MSRAVDLKVNNSSNHKLSFPNGHDTILMHSCCAPCAVELMVNLQENGIIVKILFYNPNIHPAPEYILRKEENKRFADKLQMEFFDEDYNPKQWFNQIQGLQNEPERGLRCTVCFDMRLQYTAAYAYNNGINLITSSLGISRWKDLEQINFCGLNACAKYPGLSYYTYNWRKFGGASRMIEYSKQEHFYQPQYCGCVS